MRCIAIAGNGCGAAECAIALREKGYDGKIQMFSDNSLAPANPMLTTYYASGRIPYEGMFPYGGRFYEEYDIEFHGGEPVTAVRAAARQLETDKGVYDFDRLLVATGAGAVRPPIPGSHLEKVLAVRTTEDAVALKRAAEEKPKDIVVVGASMVGIKVVEMFHKIGTRVVLADLAPYIFPLAASEGCARKIEAYLEEKGIRLAMGGQLKAIEERAGRLAAVFGDGTELPCDYLAMCVGVRANLGFMNREEVEMDRGILVNHFMQSSVPYIYAAGDVAQATNLSNGQRQIIGLLANARDQGRAAGLHMMGAAGSFEGSFAHNITHFMDVDFVGIGDVKDYDQVKEYEKNGVFCQLFYKNGVLRGINSINSMEQSGVIKHLMMKQVLGGSSCREPAGSLEVLNQYHALAESGWKEMLK